MKFLFAFLLAALAIHIAHAQVNLNNGLLAYYPFNGDAKDASGNGNDGVPMNGAQLTTDRFGNANSAFYFDGIDDYISINDNGKLSPANVSVVAYVNTESTLFQSIIGKIEYTTGYATTYNMGVNYQIQTGFYFGVTQIPGSCFQQYPYVPAYFVNSASNFSTNTWHCLVGTYENSNLKIYVDGILVDSKTITYSSLVTCTNTQLLIGSWWSGDPAKFKGKIDEVRIYNRALNQQEVSALCNIQTSPSLCSGSLGDPVINITFGSGTNPGPTLPSVVPGASTTLTYIPVSGNPANPTPVDGQYTITNNIPYNDAWFSGSPNHTTNDPNGYMAFYNSSEQPGEFYKETINNLCGSTTYEFAAWIANALDPSKIIGVNPDITFFIEQTDGTLLASFDTGPISQTNIFTWQQYGFYFTTPSNASTLVLRMINNSPGGNANVGNDLAIDDITFRACGPPTTASFNSVTFQDSISVCGGSNLILYGNTINGYINPGYLWQVSSDSGKTWTDIPNSNMLQINFSAPSSAIPKNYKYRMLTGEGNNINSINCRVASNTTILNIKPPPLGKLTGSNICIGDVASLQLISTAGSALFSISYTDGINTFTQNNLNNNSTFPTPYSLTDTTTFILTSITDGAGCSIINPPDSAVTINANPIPQGGITGSTACENNPGYISFNITQGRPSYSFVVNDGTNNININDVEAIGAFSVPATNVNKTYTLLSVTDKDGCTRTSNFTAATATINILLSPKISFGALPAICKNDSSFTITQATEISGIQGSGLFYGNAVMASGFFNPSLVNPGTYPIEYKFTAVNGCSDSSIQPITVKPIPVANAGPDLLGCINTSIQLNASGGTYYLWTPPTGLSNPAIADPMVMINTTASYIVAVTNAEGCTAYDSLTIIISPLGKAAYKVPNAFTPNGDGKNDCFGLQHWGGIDLKEFSIYNRWGQLIFSTRNPSACWDGTFKGIPQDSGGFIYIIRAITPCGNISLKGTVFLIR